MRWRTLSGFALTVTLLALAILACGGAEPTLAPATPTPPEKAEAPSPCGDGVCDEVEQKNPNLCPEDCPPTEEPEPPTAAPTVAPVEVPTEPPTEAPADTPLPEPTEALDKCGDGVCDEVEAKDPSACPKDCGPEETAPASPTPEAAITVEVTEAPTEAPPPTPTPAPAVDARASTTTPAGEFAYMGDPSTISQEGASEAEQPQSNVALILDGSGSMGEDLPGSGKTKLAVAKAVMADLIPQIPAELNSTLWIYAHRYPPDPKAESCKDIEQVFPLGPVDAAAYTSAIQGIKANGWTPIADSIIAAAEKLPAGDFNSMILVSDGEETCGGNPCAVAEALKDSDVALTVHVVGYAVDDATREQLECIAAVSGGSYHDATDAEGLLRALEEALAAAVVETVLRLEIVDPTGAEVHNQMLLYEAGTDQKMSYYDAWKDNVVPPGIYDLEVFTLPKILYPDLELPEGSTTVVRIVQGSLSVMTPEGQHTAAVYFDAGSGADLGGRGHEEPVVLVPGTYQVEVNSSSSAPVPVGAGEAVEIVLGTILVSSPDGERVPAVFWNVTTDERLGSYGHGHEEPAMFVPGTYQAGVNESWSEPITLESGQTVELVLGEIQVLSPDGEPVAAVFWDAATDKRLGSYGHDGPALFVPGSYIVDISQSYSEPIGLAPGQSMEFQLGAVNVDGGFTIWDSQGNRLGRYADTMPLVPGTYRLELDDGTIVEEAVVEAGQVTEVP